MGSGPPQRAETPIPVPLSPSPIPRRADQVRSRWQWFNDDGSSLFALGSIAGFAHAVGGMDPKVADFGQPIALVPQCTRVFIVVSAKRGTQNSHLSGRAQRSGQGQDTEEDMSEANFETASGNSGRRRRTRRNVEVRNRLMLR